MVVTISGIFFILKHARIEGKRCQHRLESKSIMEDKKSVCFDWFHDQSTEKLLNKTVNITLNEEPDDPAKTCFTTFV